jgi:hypothetical protein
LAAANTPIQPLPVHNSIGDFQEDELRTFPRAIFTRIALLLKPLRHLSGAGELKKEIYYEYDYQGLRRGITARDIILA